MKRLFKFQYPKLALLFIVIISAGIIFRNQTVQTFFASLPADSYGIILLAGTLFSFGFTTPFAIGIFALMNPSNVIIAGLVGGLGGTLADITIFHIIRFSFMDEFNRLKHTRTLKKTITLLDKSTPDRVQSYLLYVVAGIIIASPLPDELGVSMLAGLSHIKTSTLMIISFICNSLGILFFLSI